MNAKVDASTPKPAPSTIRSGHAKKRKRGHSLESEIRRQARQIYEQGMADAMKAAALMIVARKLDEIKALLQATGVNAPVVGVANWNSPVAPQPQLAPVVRNPCVHCGREGVYKSKPSQWNRTGSWACRAHIALLGQIEQEDRLDKAIQPQPTPAPPSALAPQPAPGASSLEAAMGLAEVVDERS